MLIERRSLMSGVIRTLDLPVTEEQIEAWENGALIQEAMPDLTDSQREFIVSGLTADEWFQMFVEYDSLPEEDDEEIDYFSD